VPLNSFVLKVFLLASRPSFYYRSLARGPAPLWRFVLNGLRLIMRAGAHLHAQLTQTLSWIASTLRPLPVSSLHVSTHQTLYNLLAMEN
jgi:hypothetical protein